MRLLDARFPSNLACSLAPSTRARGFLSHHSSSRSPRVWKIITISSGLDPSTAPSATFLSSFSMRLAVLALGALLAAGVVSAAPTSVSRVPLGDRLERDFTVYTSMPSTASDAKAAGWVPLSECMDGLGVPFAQSDAGLTESKPLVLYFTPAGQASGVGALFRGEYPDNLIQKGYLQNIGQSEYFISVSFRSAAESCSSSMSPLYLGDRLVINAGSGGIAEELPLTKTCLLYTSPSPRD